MKKYITLPLLCLIAHNALSQCTNFQISANKTNVCAPDIIRFDVLNAVAGSTYEWNVGNGAVSGADTFFSFFTIPTIVNASVKITLPGGQVCTVTDNGIAAVNSPPIPAFTASDVLFCEGPDSVELTDVTPNSVSRSWIVEGSNYSNTDISFKHKFVTSGAKDVSLIVTDINGCQGVREFNDTIQVFDDPNFSFAPDKKSGCAPLDVNVSLTNDPALNPHTKSYTWRFSGHPSATDSKVVPSMRTYTTAGKFPVSLEVSVSNGCTYTAKQNDTIAVGQTATLDIKTLQDTVCVGEEITFTQLTAGLSGDVLWTFVGVPHSVKSTSNNEATIVPTARGDIDVSLTYDNYGCVSVQNFPNLTRVNGVKADFNSPNNFHCQLPHTVDLNNLSDTLDATALSYKWRILDKGTEVFTSTNSDPNFTFNTMPATYDVQLIARGDNGCIDTTTRSQFIYQDSLRLFFNVFPKIACIGQEVRILNSTRPSTYLYTDSFSWTFFDLNGIDVLDSSKYRTPTITYDSAGFYDIAVIGFNNAGCRDTLRLDDVIEVIKSDLKYAISDSVVCSGKVFNLSGFSDPPRVNYAYRWSFEHLNTGKVYTASGKEAKMTLGPFGAYKVGISHNIAGSCVISDSSIIHIGGVKAQVSLDTSNGCAPLVVKPAVNVLESYIWGSVDSSFSYQWSVSPQKGTDELSATTDTPTFTFNENNDYTIKLRIDNALGCGTSILSNKIRVGVRAGVNIRDNKICIGDSLELWDESNNGVTNVAWKLFPDVPFSSEVVDSNFLKFAIPRPGVYSLRQIVTNNEICFDTAFLPLEIIETIADFTAVDSFLRCAPIYAEFESNSSNADTLIWDFGVGETFKTTKSSAGTIYRRNSGWSSGFDIGLIAKNVEGCLDTLVREDYLIVAGPIPEFEMENFIGCEPLNVSFTDKSIDGNTFYLNYNDGSALDSSKLGDFIGVNAYTVQFPKAMRQTVMPSIIVYDSLGCAAVFEPRDSIEILRSPKPAPFFENGIEMCSPFNVLFEDTGGFTNARVWSLDETNVSTKRQDSVVETDVGTHILQLISSNSNNCQDTTIQAIEVLETPVVSFTVEDNICMNKVATFEGDIQASIPNDFVLWSFGEPGAAGNINTTDLDPSITYQSSGEKKVKFIAGLNNGCIDSAEAVIRITDEDDIDAPEIDYVSFRDNYEVEVVFNTSTISNFRNYVINVSGRSIELFDKNQTTYIQDYTTAPKLPECYSLSVKDNCELQGESSSDHCFMVLTAESREPYIIKLTWTPYTGWSGVREYAIYRKDKSGVFVKIATVDGTTTSYEDEKLCDEKYEYYVGAIHPTEGWESKSYRVIERPMYLTNNRLSSIKNVTVSDDNQIQVTWDSSTFSEFKNYVLLKYETTFAKLISEIEVNEPFYIDNEVNTSEYSYIYKVLEQDRCGYLNSADREGKSILLNGYYDEGSILYWTRYEDWESGVRQYDVEIDKQGQYSLIKTNGNTDLDYIDKKLYREITGEYCYRVYGVSNENDTSYSNRTCMNGKPLVYIPTAFTPNQDGINDKFNPILFFINQQNLKTVNNFSLVVYNRWGEKLFETENPMQGWDGTYKGAKCQQGVYVYTLKATGLNKRKIYKDGTITILRTPPIINSR